MSEVNLEMQYTKIAELVYGLFLSMENSLNLLLLDHLLPDPNIQFHTRLRASYNFFVYVNRKGLIIVDSTPDQISSFRSFQIRFSEKQNQIYKIYSKIVNL